MTTLSKIEWTETTLNPITGCTKVSPGCKNCYAKTMHNRLRAMGSPKYQHPFEEVRMHWNELESMTKLGAEPTLVFVNSMSDMFHEDVSNEFLDEYFKRIKLHRHLTFQVLTKRALRMQIYFKTRTVPDNVWLGVSVENQKMIDRITALRQIQTPHRFISCEPLLEDLGYLPLGKNASYGINWVIVGGESGPGARPMKKEWVLGIKRQCDEKGIAFFFKQWGAHNEYGERGSKRANGALLDGKLYQMAMPGNYYQKLGETNDK